MKKETLIEDIKKFLIESLKENKPIEEEIITDQPSIEFNIDDQIGNFWIVKKAMRESKEDDILQETDIFGLAEMINQQQISRADIHGIYQTENKARRMSKRCITERDQAFKTRLKEGDVMKGDLEKSIRDIQNDIESLTQKGLDYPGMVDSISSDLSPKYKKLHHQKDLLSRLQASLDSEKKFMKKDEKE